MEHKDIGIHLSLPEVPQEELISYVDNDDFLRRYGNPVIIKSEGHGDLVCMAREYYERLMTERDLFIEDENINYWIYEFAATDEKKLELERTAAKCCMTPDEFVESAVEQGLSEVIEDSVGREKRRTEISRMKDAGIWLVRYYPVFKGETEEQAYLRKLGQEVENLKRHKNGGEGP